MSAVSNADAGCRAADIRRAAVALLARREHSFVELVRKLSLRFGECDLIEEQLNALVSLDLQSDRRFCEVFVRSRCRAGHGPRRIVHALRQCGVSDSLITAHVWQGDIDWAAVLRSVCEKRFGCEPPGDSRDRARQFRFLLNRGFAPELIREITGAR